MLMQSMRCDALAVTDASVPSFHPNGSLLALPQTGDAGVILADDPPLRKLHGTPAMAPS